MNTSFIKWVFARLKEPSTWAGLTSLMTALGVAISPEQASAIVSLGVAFGTAVLILMPEPGNK